MDFLYECVHQVFIIYRECCFEIKPCDCIHFWYLVWQCDILSEDSEIHNIKMKMWRSSFGIEWNIVDSYMKNPRYDFDWFFYSWFFMKFSDSNTSYICFSITVTAELLPTSEFFMEHEEYFRHFRVHDEHGTGDMSFEIFFHKGKISMFFYPINNCSCTYCIFIL